VGTNVTQDLQQALNQPDLSYIQLSPGICLVDDTLKITNRSGLRFEGAGRGATRLAWYGGQAETMFSVQNTAYSTFAHFTACVWSGSLESVFDVYNACHDGEIMEIQSGDGLVSVVDSCTLYYPGAPPGSHENVFMDLGIRICEDSAGELDSGIRIRLHPDYDDQSQFVCGSDEEADCGNDRHLFNNVHIQNSADSSFVIEGSASVGNTFLACHCDGAARPMQGTGLPNPDRGDYCVRTGTEFAATGGAFSWFGGIAENLERSVFQLSASPESIYVSGLRARNSQMLLNSSAESPTVTSGITIESSYFDTSGVDDQLDPHGKVVYATSGGVLALRDNYFGLGHDEMESQETPDFGQVSFCWNPPMQETGNYDETERLGEFIFEGNAVISDASNPFAPPLYLGPYELQLQDCVYPTTQMSNTVLVYDKLIQGLRWRTMPQHKGVLDSAQPDHSVKDMGHSHELVDVSGGSGYIARLTGGVAGQQLVLIGTELGLGGTTIHEGTSRLLWFAPVNRKNIWRPGGQAAELHDNETLFLVKGPANHWYTVGYRLDSPDR